MTPEQENSLLLDAITTYGMEDQIGMFHEEAGELMQALNKYRRNPCEKNYNHACEEMADLDIILKQLKLGFNPELVEKFKQEKLLRLNDRLTAYKDIANEKALT